MNGQLKLIRHWGKTSSIKKDHKWINQNKWPWRKQFTLETREFFKNLFGILRIIWKKKRNSLIWIKMSHEKKSIGHREDTNLRAELLLWFWKCHRMRGEGNGEKKWKDFTECFMYDKQDIDFETIINVNQHHWLILRIITKNVCLPRDPLSIISVPQQILRITLDPPLRPWIHIEMLLLAISSFKNFLFSKYSWHSILVYISFRCIT